MPISDAEAVKFGLLVIYAEDMYVPGETKPNREPRIAQAGWEAIAYLTANDAPSGNPCCRDKRNVLDSAISFSTAFSPAM
jgi:hypothetical protein